jgi:hypothetical protein
MQRLMRLGVGFLAAVVVLAAGASAASRDASTPPTLLVPAAGAVIPAGTHLAFRITTFPGDEVGYLWLYVSRSPSVANACGTIAHDAEIEPFAATGDASVYEARPTFFDYSGFWMNTPGTYYWQAYRIHHGGGADGCIESEVRSFQIVKGDTTPTTPTPTTPTPTTPTTPAPKPARPLANARLEGSFDLKLRLTSVSGIGGVQRGSVKEVAWAFQPVCSGGACSVRLQIPPSLFGRKTATIRLQKAGVRYTGSGTAYFATCMLKPVAGSTRVTLTVTGGSWIGGSWRATRVVGSVRYRAPATSGALRCRASAIDAAVQGRLDIAY